MKPKFWQQDIVIQNTKGALWKVLACLAFAGINVFVRHLSGGSGGEDNPLSVGVIVLYQNIFGCLMMMPFVLKDGFSSLKTKRPFAHAIRVITAVFGIITLYTAFAKMPIAQAVALQFTGPIFTVIGARLYLKEKVGLLRMVGIAFGVTGAWILTRPDIALSAATFHLDDLVIFFPLLSAILIVVAKLTGRDLGKSGESSQLLTLYLLFFMIPVSAFYAMADWQLPQGHQYTMLVALGACGCLAHFATARAYSLAEVIFLTPFGFSKLFLTAVLGYTLFGEFPESDYFWQAISLILLSVLAITFGETFAQRKGKSPLSTAQPALSS